MHGFPKAKKLPITNKIDPITFEPIFVIPLLIKAAKNIPIMPVFE